LKGILFERLRRADQENGKGVTMEAGNGGASGREFAGSVAEV
jgi:hypothetical protein